MRDAIEQFRSAIKNAGLQPPELIEPDGEVHRFATNGKPGDDAGWYVLYDNEIPAGSFGDWRSGLSENWRADIGRKLSTREEAAHGVRVRAMRRQREAEDAQRKMEVRKQAAAIWQSAMPAPDDHDYLRRRGIKANGLRIDEKGRLVIPVRDGAELHSLQFIGTDGKKRFLTGGRVTGCWFLIGNPTRAAALCIAEGFATSATIHEASDYPVAVAFNAGNLKPVAQALRTIFPNLELIVCADDDAGIEGNPGLTKAREAAWAVGGKVAVPDFGTDRPDGATDFNDLRVLCSAEVVAKTIAGAPAVQAPPSEIVYRRFSDVKAKPVRWLWPGCIACGKLTVIAGNPGVAKSQLTANLAAIVSHGGQWPVENVRCEAGDVVILSAEDDAEDTIRPRLEAAGGDIQRCYILDAVIDVDEKGKPRSRAFSFTRDLDRMNGLLCELKNVRLIIIDPISAYLGNADSHKNAEIRALLSPLADLASKHAVAVVAVSHFNKTRQQEALLRVMGSLAFVAAARAAYAVVKDQYDPQRRLFLPLKNNLGRDTIGYAFTVETVTLGGGIETSRVIWEDEAVTITVEEAMTPVGDAEERSEIEDAKALLKSLLINDPVPQKLIRAVAEGAGFSWATIRRAKKALGIVSAKNGTNGPWKWKLTPKVLKDAEDAHSTNMSTVEENEPLQESEDGWEDLL